MPCYQIRTVEISFKVGNIDLLKRALENKGFAVESSNETRIRFNSKDFYRRPITIDLKTSKITSIGFDEKGLTVIGNSIKRAYSEQVIDEIAKRQKWMKKKMGENKFQLQRF